MTSEEGSEGDRVAASVSMEYYGNRESTGLDQTASGGPLTGLTRRDPAMSCEDRAVLRRLAERVTAIAPSSRVT